MRRKRSRHTIDPGIPWRPALGAVLPAALVLGATFVPFPVAGASAFLLDKHLWLDGMPLVTNPLWGLIARTLALLVPSAPIAALNLFSVCCGLVSIALFYRLNARMLQLAHPNRSTRVYVFCGICAALFLTASVPFWIICSRAHPLSFDLALLLAALYCQSEYQRTGKIRRLNQFGFLFGIGLVEYPATAILAWPLAVLTLYLMRRRGHLRRSKRKKNLATGVGWVAAGILLAVAVAWWQMTRSPARLWMDDAAWERLLRLFLAAEWAKLLASVPRTGWILIGMVSVVPWAACLVETRGRASLHHLPSLLVYVVLSALILMILYNASFAPHIVLGRRGQVILPYLFIAGTFGLLMNYWRAAIFRLWSKQQRSAPWLRNGLIALLPACVVAAPVVNFHRVDPTPTRILYECAVEIVDAMGGRSWLVTDGSFDSLLRLSARAAGKDIELLNVMNGKDPRYRRLVASRFPDARYRSLARLGPLPLLREMLRTDPEITGTLAFMNTGNMWMESGFEVQPERLIYLGRRPGEPGESADAVLDRHVAFWARTVDRLWQTETDDPAHAVLARHLRWRISRAANDLGVTFQRAGHEAAAREAYRAARTANDLNASALINLAGNGDEDMPEAVRDELNLPIPRLVARHGHVNQLSQLFARRGAEDVARIVMPEAIRRRFIDVSAYYRSDDLVRALEELEAILAEEPDDPMAWYLRGLLAALAGDEEAWRASYRFMSTLERPWPAFLLIQGEGLLKAGHVTDGLALYELALNLSPYDPRIARPVAVAQFTFGSRRHAESFVTRLLSLDPSDPWGNFALGTIQFERDEYMLAESSLRVAVEKLKIPNAHNNLAWLLMVNGKIEEAKEQVAAALRLDPTFVPAWDTMGVIHMKDGNLEDAGTAFQRALQLSPQSWDARVHSAQLALARGREADAAAVARELEREADGKSRAALADYRTLRNDLGLPPLVPSE